MVLALKGLIVYRQSSAQMQHSVLRAVPTDMQIPGEQRLRAPNLAIPGKSRRASQWRWHRGRTVRNKLELAHQITPREHLTVTSFITRPGLVLCD